MRNRKQSRFLLDRVEGEDIISRISKVIDKVISNLHQVSDDELYIRMIKKILALELVFGTLGNLKDKQIKAFDEAVKRRSVF